MEKTPLYAITSLEIRAPFGAREMRQGKAGRLDVILQIGAHRTASTSFQTYLRRNGAELAALKVGSWGPYRLRKGMCHGIVPNPNLGVGPRHFARAKGKIAMHLERSVQKGLDHLIVSEENILGKMRHNFASQSLYPAAGERIARYVAAFDGTVKAIHLNLRCPSTYWTSALSFCIPRGVMVPREKRIAGIAASRRAWRDVITDVAAAAPNTAIFVSTFEEHAAVPHLVLSYLLGLPAPKGKTQIWHNQRPSAQRLLDLPLGNAEMLRLRAHIQGTRWEPFSHAHRMVFQETYSDDLFWLRSGADGLAHLLEDPKSEKTGYPAELDFVNKGHRHDARQRMARPR